MLCCRYLYTCKEYDTIMNICAVGYTSCMLQGTVRLPQGYLYTKQNELSLSPPMPYDSRCLNSAWNTRLILILIEFSRYVEKNVASSLIFSFAHNSLHNLQSSKPANNIKLLYNSYWNSKYCDWVPLPHWDTDLRRWYSDSLDFSYLNPTVQFLHSRKIIRKFSLKYKANPLIRNRC